jgi:tRNA(Ile)-lysidine synthetase-like protein
LSGGVDSIVCCWCLVNTFKNITALHINYNNRKTSDEEERFVRWWCGKIGIKCYVRKISEIKRDACMKYGLRDVYETYTRNVRYSCYKQFGDSVIILGHNKDDILENLFTNIANKTKYDNFSSKKNIYFFKQDNINFYRPLLDKTKREIAIYAHENNIPYLPTSKLNT